MGQRLNVEIIQGGKAVCNVYMHWSAYTSVAKSILNDIINKFDEKNIDNKSSLKDIVLALMAAIDGARTTPDEEVKLGLVKSTKVEDYHFEDYKDLLEKYPKLLKGVNVKDVDDDFNIKAMKKMSRDDFEKFINWRRKINISRNDGIISTTEKGMKETRYWEEGRIECNIDDNTIYFNVGSADDIDKIINENTNLPDDEKEYIFTGDNIYYKKWDGELYKFEKYNLNFNWHDNMSIDEWRKLSSIIDETIKDYPYGCIINNLIVSWIE